MDVIVRGFSFAYIHTRARVSGGKSVSITIMQIKREMVLKLLPHVSSVGPYATSEISQDLKIHRNYVYAAMLTDNVGIVVPSPAVTKTQTRIAAHSASLFGGCNGLLP